MNIYTVRDNLKKTIEGKENYLTEMKQNYMLSTMAESRALSTAIKFLAINIDELKKILADVETCCEKATQDSWALNPDRSGGQYTQDELCDISRDG